ncbi:hypothetical protein L0U85_12165 [Glycomyces sp. L485]|uniref:hypothetical protein n=1 Tax=Glycomyces sp. L485 TaxID=2909235 RepID=UPI001F4BB534|nr:hypothetical protein [Glycomyces sp. L485]MCH7231599.1 hypothetical protein [Glycomyces sp. L485]
MTGKFSITKVGLLKLGLLAGALLIVAAVLYEGISWRPQGQESPDDRAFGSTGTECEDLQLDQYSDLIAPIYLPWGEPTERHTNERPGYASVTCYSQTTVTEDLCAEVQSDDCIDWYSEPISILNQLYVRVEYHENAREAADSLDIGYEPVTPSKTWDEVYESTSERSWGEQVELVSIFRADNMTIELQSIIGKPIQTEAIIDEVFKAHSSLAESIAQAAEL